MGSGLASANTCLEERPERGADMTKIHQERPQTLVVDSRFPGGGKLLPTIAISVRQPWAWLIVHGHKSYENREWNFRHPWRGFRGRALIHASQGMTKKEYDEARSIAANYGIQVPDCGTLDRGGVVGVVSFVDWCNHPPSLPFTFGSGFTLASAEPLPFMPCKGALGFFRVNYQPPAETLPEPTIHPELAL